MNSRELERTLWATAKKLWNSAEPAEYMHMVLGLVFLRYITDVNDRPDKDLVKGEDNSSVNGKNEEHLAYNEYFVPKKAQWNFLQSQAGQPDFRLLIDDAIDAIEKLNKNLREIFYQNYANPRLDRQVLGQLMELIGNISVNKQGNIKEPLSKLFDNLLGIFAEEGKNEAQFYTPQDIVRLLAEMTEPRKGRVYDGCCGTGSMFVQSKKFIQKYRVSIDNLSFYGQDNNAAIIKIAKMNLVLHGIDADLQAGNTFTNDCYPELSADFILASPPLNLSNWKGNQLTNDKRWQFGEPPEGNANYAWLQHFISKLSPAGTAGIVLDNSSINSTAAQERKIRKGLIEARLVDCIVALPSHLFYNTDRPVCLWLLTKNKTNNKYRNPGNEVLFIDARRFGVGSNGRKKTLKDENILLISGTYLRWRNINGDYIDLKGFCKAVSMETISKNSYSLKPEKYISGGGVKKALPVFLLTIFLAAFYFFSVQTGLFTFKSSLHDTVLTVQPKVVTDSSPSEKKRSEIVSKKENDISAEEKSGTVINQPVTEPVNQTADTLANSPVTEPADRTVNKPANPPANEPDEQRPAIKEDIQPAEEEQTSNAISYKVISKAYFYDEPDETTRRRAFISHWNNSYADIRASDEKNGFIYVIFKNHLNQTSKGWLRKKDLEEVNQ